MSNDIFNATLIARHDLTPDLSVVCICGDDGVVPDFQPGQFVTLGLPRPVETIPALVEGRAPNGRLVRRAYSIASSPKERRYLELYVVLVEDGKLTPRLWNVEQGGRLYMDPRIRGEFTLGDVPSDSHIVLVATGTGVAPFISMVRTYRDCNRWRRCTLVHGVREIEQLGYREEMEAIAREDQSFVYIPVVSGKTVAEQTWTGRRGRVQSLFNEAAFRELTSEPLVPEDTHVFLCGNPAMIVDVQTILESRGFITQTKSQPGNLHFERYW
ncbi:MAG: ferredoxin--NADP reductase [Phycisphaerales bacterium]|nr:ferredoxin--NADP reductase [Phycisphaerales bacterium]